MTAVLEHFLTNKKFKEYAEFCGIVIDGDNYKATALEFEYLLEQVVHRCVSMVKIVQIRLQIKLLLISWNSLNCDILENSFSKKSF